MEFGPVKGILRRCLQLLFILCLSLVVAVSFIFQMGKAVHSLIVTCKIKEFVSLKMEEKQVFFDSDVQKKNNNVDFFALQLFTRAGINDDRLRCAIDLKNKLETAMKKYKEMNICFKERKVVSFQKFCITREDHQ